MQQALRRHRSRRGADLLHLFSVLVLLVRLLFHLPPAPLTAVIRSLRGIICTLNGISVPSTASSETLTVAPRATLLRPVAGTCDTRSTDIGLPRQGVAPLLPFREHAPHHTAHTQRATRSRQRLSRAGPVPSGRTALRRRGGLTVACGHTAPPVRHLARSRASLVRHVSSPPKSRCRPAPAGAVSVHGYSGTSSTLPGPSTPATAGPNASMHGGAWPQLQGGGGAQGS
jgi:hypothetical protein